VISWLYSTDGIVDSSTIYTVSGLADSSKTHQREKHVM
jgi:hypothetical protein